MMYITTNAGGKMYTYGDAVDTLQGILNVIHTGLDAAHDLDQQIIQAVPLIKELIAMPSGQIDQIVNFDFEKIKTEFAAMRAELDTLKEIKVTIDGEVEVSVQNQGKSFWDKLIDLGTGTLGAAINTGISTAGSMREATIKTATAGIDGAVSKAGLGKNFSRVTWYS